ncbi:hypothetical protein BH20ACI1_BH20ACI1_15230 [soil metagenome]
MKRKSLYFLLLPTGLFVFCFLWFNENNGMFSVKAENVKIDNQSASGGREITPAGKLLIDATTGQPAVGALPVDFVRSPDNTGFDGKGRYLLTINSGFGLQFNASTNRAQQSISVIDLNEKPEPKVIQNVYFPSPQSVNVGAAFAHKPNADGSYNLFVSGGFENKIWIFKFRANDKTPITPTSNGFDTKVDAPFIDVSMFAENAPTPIYNDNKAAVYPTGIGLSPDDNTLFVANNLGDTLGIVGDLRGRRKISRISLGREGSEQFVYPYQVAVLPSKDNKTAEKIYVSLWGDGTIAVVDGKNPTKTVKHIAVNRHPTAMIFNRAKSRLYVVNSNADAVSIIDTGNDKVLETVSVKLSEDSLIGSSPESLALSDDEKTLYVANAHANAVGVVSLESGVVSPKTEKNDSRLSTLDSRLSGFIPTGQYPSAVAVVGNKLFIGNGKGTGVENSSVIVNNSGRFPNILNDRFPALGTRRGGQYSVSIVSGNISLVEMPNEVSLAKYTRQVMQNNGLIKSKDKPLFKNGKSPFKHIIYIIKENRTYDQVFGDLANSGDGAKADGDANLAIFGAGEAAQSPNEKSQNITPNHRALALRFGLFDRFFVNAEASPDGHNWSTAAFSNDYVDKAFRWDYSGRGRTYDYEGFNRLPSYIAPNYLPPIFDLPVTEDDLANYMKRYIPYLRGGRDVAEPETLYLWDAAARKGLTHRNLGEFVATISEEDVKAVNTRRGKSYPDISLTLKAFPTKKTLEGNFSPTFPNYDLLIPDILTIDSYKAMKESNGKVDGKITRDNADEKFRGTSRFGEWQSEFRGYLADLQNGKGDTMPNLTVMRFPNDHTSGLRANVPTPQFYVAENDYAVGKVVEEVSKSPYWKDTAIVIVEDDAQDGSDHVDAHRSVALVISAYNRKGALIHDFHNTVSLIRTMEILLGIPPMNQLDATASPIDIFQNEPDLTPFAAILPDVALDNLTPPRNVSAEMLKYMKLTDEQNLAHADMANPRELNEIIWFSVRGNVSEMPEIARLPAFDLMTAGIVKEEDEEEREEQFEEIETRAKVIKTLAKR